MKSSVVLMLSLYTSYWIVPCHTISSVPNLRHYWRRLFSDLSWYNYRLGERYIHKTAPLCLTTETRCSFMAEIKNARFSNEEAFNLFLGRKLCLAKLFLSATRHRKAFVWVTDFPLKIYTTFAEFYTNSKESHTKVLHRSVLDFWRSLEKYITSVPDIFLFWLILSVYAYIYIICVYSRASLELNEDVVLDRLLYCDKWSNQVCADFLSEALWERQSAPLCLQELRSIQLESLKCSVKNAKAAVSCWVIEITDFLSS